MTPRLAVTMLTLLMAPANSSAAAAASLDGRVVVTEKDITDYQAAQACYGEGALTSRRAAFMRLLEAEIASAAMRAHGGPASTPDALTEEAVRIDRETRAPEILACIKKYFGADAARYRRVFVKPVFVESRLRAFLSYDPGVQAPAKKSVALAASRVRAGAALEAAAKETGLSYSSATYSMSASSGAASASPAELARYGIEWSPHEPEFIEKYLKGLAVGQMTAQPVETDYDFRLVRLLETDGARWRFESASAQKITQENWLKSLPKMRLAIADADLRSWIAGIRGNPRLNAVTLAP